MFRFLRLLVFLGAMIWAIQHHYHGKEPGASSSASSGSGGTYTAAQGGPPVIVYGIQCIQTRTYRKMLEKNGIRYEYRDINAPFSSPAYRSDLKPRLDASGIAPQTAAAK